ncbi:hypothetical protein OS493_022978 [Desmophyllum pertusum]|uniref:A20-type domain-containing protein n=1 Tax=Desmophyllum pertusum TaxID=174260 RepID=A0A9W9ZDZ2_9CNID|nr:hypothetical protein OS493_022978 [Desmophyllum pertusum]
MDMWNKEILLRPAVVEICNRQKQLQLKWPALKVTLLPCNSTACLRFGTPDTNGLCEDCYRKKVNTQPSTTSTTEASKQQRGPSVSGKLPQCSKLLRRIVSSVTALNQHLAYFRDLCKSRRLKDLA